MNVEKTKTRERRKGDCLVNISPRSQLLSALVSQKRWAGRLRSKHKQPPHTTRSQKEECIGVYQHAKGPASSRAGEMQISRRAKFLLLSRCQEGSEAKGTARLTKDSRPHSEKTLPVFIHPAAFSQKQSNPGEVNYWCLPWEAPSLHSTFSAQTSDYFDPSLPALRDVDEAINLAGTGLKLIPVILSPLKNFNQPKFCLKEILGWKNIGYRKSCLKNLSLVFLFCSPS